MPKIGAMTHEDLIQHFGSQAKVARAVGISSASVDEWKGGVPELRQLEFQKLTGGKLKAAPGVVRKYRELLPSRAA